MTWNFSDTFIIGIFSLGYLNFGRVSALNSITKHFQTGQHFPFTHIVTDCALDYNIYCWRSLNRNDYIAFFKVHMSQHRPWTRSELVKPKGINQNWSKQLYWEHIWYASSGLPLVGSKTKLICRSFNLLNSFKTRHHLSLLSIPQPRWQK